MTKNLGNLLLAAFLIVSGLAHFVAIAQLGLVLAILAIAAGVCLLLGK